MHPKPNAILPNTSATINFLRLAEAQANDSDLMELLLNNTTSIVLKQVPVGEHHTTIFVTTSLVDCDICCLKAITSWNYDQQEINGSTCDEILPNKLENAKSVPVQKSFATTLLHWKRLLPPQVPLTHVYVDNTIGVSHNYTYCE